MRRLVAALGFALHVAAMSVILPFALLFSAGIVIFLRHPLRNAGDLSSGFILLAIVFALWIAPGRKFWPSLAPHVRRRRPWARLAKLAFFASACLFAILRHRP